MSADGVVEQDLILAHARSVVAIQVYDEIPDDTQLLKDPVSLKIEPYILVRFGEMTDVPNDRTIMGEEQQPARMPVIFEVWAATSTDARHVAGVVRSAFRGWFGNQNMSPLQFRGGGSFLNRDSAGVPSRFLRTITMQTDLNQSVDTTFSPN